MISGALSTLFESAPGAILDDDTLLRVYGDDLNALLSARWLRELKSAAELICTSCGAPHHVSVERSEVHGELVAYCADGAGWIGVEPERLRRFSFEHERFVAAMSKALGLTGKPETLVGGVCWRLGYATIAGAQAAMVVAREMNDPRAVMEIATALKHRQGAGHGLILCGAAPIVDLGAYPRGVRTMLLSDLIRFNAACEMTIDLGAAAVALALKRRRPGEHGAPSAHPELLARIDDRARTGVSGVTAADEADQLLAASTWSSADQPLPGRETLRRLISRRWQYLRRTN